MLPSVSQEAWASPAAAAAAAAYAVRPGQQQTPVLLPPAVAQQAQQQQSAALLAAQLQQTPSVTSPPDTAGTAAPSSAAPSSAGLPSVPGSTARPAAVSAAEAAALSELAVNLDKKEALLVQLRAMNDEAAAGVHAVRGGAGGSGGGAAGGADVSQAFKLAYAKVVLQLRDVSAMPCFGAAYRLMRLGACKRSSGAGGPAAIGCTNAWGPLQQAPYSGCWAPQPACLYLTGCPNSRYFTRQLNDQPALCLYFFLYLSPPADQREGGRKADGAGGAAEGGGAGGLCAQGGGGGGGQRARRRRSSGAGGRAAGRPAPQAALGLAAASMRARISLLHTALQPRQCCSLPPRGPALLIPGYLCTAARSRPRHRLP